MLIRRIYCLFTLCLLHCSNSHASDVFFVTEDLPPLQIAHKTTPPTGAMVDLVKEIIKEINVEASIISLPWARAYNMAQKTKNVFIFSVLRSEEREQDFHWVGHIYTIRAHLATLKKNSHITVDSIKDARPYKVGVIRHALAENYLIRNGFKANKNMYISKSYPSLWNNLFNGYTDLTFTNNIIWQPQLIKAGLDPKEVTLVSEVKGFATNMYLAANKQTDLILLNQVEKALEKIKEDGRYDKIINQWQL